MSFLKVNFETAQTTFDSFDRIAGKIVKDINLKINDAYYRITDFEFYVRSAVLPDPYTYGDVQQLQFGKLFLHASGIDLTFGDGTNYGGILLRGVVKLYSGSNQQSGFMKEHFEGPQKVATELFSNISSLFEGGHNEVSIVDVDGRNQDALFYPAKKVIKTKRVGLGAKSKDMDEFYRNLPLRYIAILQQFPDFKYKVTGIESLLEEQIALKKMTVAEAQEILGYQKKF